MLAEFLEDLGMKIDIRNRLNRSKYDYKEEKELLLANDIILYLFDISKLFSTTEKDDYFKKIETEIKVYSQVLDSKQKKIDRILPLTISAFLRAADEPSYPEEKIFIALGTCYDKLGELKLTKNEIEIQFENIREKFKNLFNFNCQWNIRFFNSLVDDTRKLEMVTGIFGILKKFYGGSKGSIDNDYETVYNIKFKTLGKPIK